MALFTKESLETLRNRVDLVEVIGGHIDLKAAGAAYKALCPFHDEKTPSFTIQRGDTHYHCFGCGAHGDAIQFLMEHQQLPFADAVEQLGDRFGVSLERTESRGERGPDKKRLKEVLDQACTFYHYCLLHTAEGHEALKYLYGRGIDLDFVHRFRIGLSPKEPGLFRKAMLSQGASKGQLIETGLAAERDGGRLRDFFYDRIMFPIQDNTGAIIGFSGRKYKEDTFGGKYVNTSETSLFKKWRVLYGLNHCRRQIAKEKRAVVVEGQVDCLRLIQEGLPITVAGQGTAFGDGHVDQLISLGVQKVYLALDGDSAGQEATAKIGNLFQKQGIDVRVVAIPQGEDPDTLLQKQGIQGVIALVDGAEGYLRFLVRYSATQYDMSSPAGKNQLISKLVGQIREWDDPVMVYESLRKLAQLTGVPEQTVGVDQQVVPTIHFRKKDTIGSTDIDADRILESDLLRWLVVAGETNPEIVALAMANLHGKYFRDEGCRGVYEAYCSLYTAGEARDMVSLANSCENQAGQALLSGLSKRRVNVDRLDEQFPVTIQRILDREWMEECEAIKRRIASGELDDDAALTLAKEFGELKRNPPSVNTAVAAEGEVRDVGEGMEHPTAGDVGIREEIDGEAPAIL